MGIHHVFDAGVFFQAVHGQVFAIARHFEATVRHFCGERDVGVDPHAAIVHVFAKAHHAGIAARPHTRSQTIIHTIGHGQGFVIAVEFLHRDDRAEDFGLNGFVVLLQTPKAYRPRLADWVSS